MKIEDIPKKLESTGELFIYDDFEKCAVRMKIVDGELKTYLKHKGRQEVEVDNSYETAFDIQLGGKEISKKEYKEL